MINNNTDAGLHVVIELVGEHIYTITLCVCVFVRKTSEAGSLVVLFIRQCRLLLNKYEFTRELNSWIDTHAHRVIVYICSPTNSMTTCYPASALVLIYARGNEVYYTNNIFFL